MFGGSRRRLRLVAQLCKTNARTGPKRGIRIQGRGAAIGRDCRSAFPELLVGVSEPEGDFRGAWTEGPPAEGLSLGEVVDSVGRRAVEDGLARAGDEVAETDLIFRSGGQRARLGSGRVWGSRFGGGGSERVA